MKKLTRQKSQYKTMSNKSLNLSFWEKFSKFTLNRWVLLCMIAILTIIFLGNYSAIFDKKIDNNGDNIYYYSLGQSMSEGNGFTNIMSMTPSPHTHFPPGYPAFLSLLMKIHPNDIQAIKKANGFLLWGSMVLLFFLLCKITKNSILAFLSSMLLVSHGGVLRFSTIMMSETLFMFLSLLAVFFAVILIQWDFSIDKEKMSIRRRCKLIGTLLLLALTVAYIYFVRTFGISLICALIGWCGLLTIQSLVKWLKVRKSIDNENLENELLIRKQLILRTLMLLGMTMSFGIAVLSWEHRNQSINFTKGSAYVSDFMKKPNGETMQTAEDWKIRIKSNTSSFLTRWIPEDVYYKSYNKDEKITSKEWISGIVLLLLIIGGCCYLRTGRLLVLFYIFISVCVLILYPEQYGGTRYLTPVTPFFILAALNGIAAIIAVLLKLLHKENATLLVQALVLIVVVFGLVKPKYVSGQKEALDLAKIKSWHHVNDIRMNNYLYACEWCKDSIPDNARIVCRKPELFYMYSNYHKADMFPMYAAPDTIYNFFKKNNIEYVIIDDWFKHAYTTIIPCVQKYPEKFMIVKEFGKTDTVTKTNPTYILKFNDEWGYTGDLVDGVREGQGTLLMQDGRRYTGSFSHGEPNGFGILYDADSNIVAKGNWTNGICYH